MPEQSSKGKRTLAKAILVPECPPEGCVRKVYHLESIAYIVALVEMILLCIGLVVDIIFICRDGNNDDWMTAHICFLSVAGTLVVSCLLMMLGAYSGRRGRFFMMPWVLLHGIILLFFLPAGKTTRSAVLLLL